MVFIDLLTKVFNYHSQMKLGLKGKVQTVFRQDKEGRAKY